MSNKDSLKTLRNWTVANLERINQHHIFNARTWVRLPNLKLYVRLTTRLASTAPGAPLTPVPTLDLASMEVVPTAKQGKGILTRYAANIEKLADELNLHIYVESVLQERFAKFWINRGYIPRDPNSNQDWSAKESGTYLPINFIRRPGTKPLEAAQGQDDQYLQAVRATVFSAPPQILRDMTDTPDTHDTQSAQEG